MDRPRDRPLFSGVSRSPVPLYHTRPGVVFSISGGLPITPKLLVSRLFRAVPLNFEEFTEHPPTFRNRPGSFPRNRPGSFPLLFLTNYFFSW